ncbi:563_t:CDS:2 [Cetraspora pellucida]|uniref:563_t:CDS:1 n=1 Tax=Cetraspora pellucida TaxID=1433469 RepID=A0ACA9NLM5_9GLOM|nr:563_t:CDS:2 [Cetraspora pellucida]
MLANIHILQNIKGHQLGSICEEELEKKIHDAIKFKAEINKLSEKLQDKYIKQMKAFDRERKGWNQNSLRNNTEIQKLRTHALQMRSGPEALPLPIGEIGAIPVATTLMLEVPLLRRPEGATLDSKKRQSLESLIYHFFEIKSHKKSDRLRDMWIR